MGNKIFYVYAAREDSSQAEAFLNLPAAPYEVLDALDKLRLSEGESVKVGIEEHYRFGSLAPILSEKYDLCELNALAQKLSALDDWQGIAFEGLLEMESAKWDGPIELPRLIDLAGSVDCCHVVSEALNDSQLGRFLAENGLAPGAEDLSDEAYELLDFERIGREHRQQEGGVLVERTPDHPGGYVEQHSDLREVYSTLDLTAKAPDYTILLEVSDGPNSSKVTQLKMPASLDDLEAAMLELEVWDWREADWSCLDCQVPALTDMISDEEDIHAVNRFARRLSNMEPEALTAYKALLSAAECESLDRADQLMDQLDQCIFSPQISSPVEAARGELSAILAEPDVEMIAPHLNLYQYGEALIQHCGGVLTPYGLIEREDRQPVQTMEEAPVQGGMEMM